MIAAVAAMLATGCSKSEMGQTSLTFRVEGSGAKTTVDHVETFWQRSERYIWVNYKAYGLSVSDSSAAAEVNLVDAEADYRVVYPASTRPYCTRWPVSATEDAEVELTMPASYPYATEDGRQVLHSPLAGYVKHNDEGMVVVLKHLTAALELTLTNSTGKVARMASITVASNSYQLSGRRSFSLKEDGSVVVAPQTTGADTAKRVTVTYPDAGDDAVVLANGATHTVQVPVLPVGSGNKFTVTVVMVDTASGGATYTLTKTQATGGALDRAVLAIVSATVSADKVLSGNFSVSSSKKVRFSPGNLQYNAVQGTHATATGTAAGTWRFAEHQYDVIGEANRNASASYNGWIDLFGWGTSGWKSEASAYQPWNTSTQQRDYTPGGSATNNLTATYAKADWGVYNAISNGGNQPGQWRTLTKDEWGYLFYDRKESNGTASTVNGIADARYAKAQVCGINGVIVFPDTYVHPSSVEQPTSINKVGVAYTKNVYDAAAWSAMEAAGCVFLPVTGYRNGTSVSNATTYGYYWSTTYANVEHAYRVAFFYSESVRSGNIDAKDASPNRDWGQSVRLVQDL